VKLALAGDTMLGRGVAQSLLEGGRDPFSAEVVSAAAEADLFVLNLECCISTRGERWRAPGKPFFFRAPPRAAEVLAQMGVDCVTLANNHALDFGTEALLDTFEHLRAVGVRWVGAGVEQGSARAPVRLRAGAGELTVLACADHPRDFAAGGSRPGIAFGDLREGVPAWLLDAVGALAAHGTVLVTPHWGPNMTSEPRGYVRAAARALVEAGATLVAGHSAHVFHGVAGRVLYDLGDFIDDYVVDPRLRNDLGLLFLVTLERARPMRLETLPLKLDYCHTRIARGEDAAWIRQRFRAACVALGTEVEFAGERMAVVLDGAGPES
jgi:poly-gamma-glutamate synthesis protein (capsule biosynthesis protein)